MNPKSYLLKRCAAALTIIAGIVPLLVMAGWQYNIEMLKRPVPGLMSMNPVAALCFILSAGLLWLLIKKDHSKIAPRFVKTVSPVIAITGLLKLFSIVFNQHFEIDAWLFSKKLVIENVEGGVPSRMCTITAVNMLLLGVALFISTFKNKKLKIIANYTAFLVLAIGMFSMIGYIFKVKEIYGFQSHISMPVYTAVCFVVSSLALLFYQNSIGFMQTFTSASSGGSMARLLIPAVVVVPVTFGYIRLRLFWEHPFSVELGVAVLITCIIIVFYIIIWRFAAALNKTDDAKRQAEEKLWELNRQLEQKVVARTKEAMAHENKFRAVVESSFDMISLLDADLKHFFRSNSSEHITGWPATELEAIGSVSIVHPDDLAQLAAIMESVKKTPGKPFNCSLRLRHKSGHYIWVEGNLTNYLDNANIKAIVSSFSDITQRKKIAEQLEKSEVRLKEAQALASMGNWEVTLETGENTWSDEMFSIFGLAPGEREPSTEGFISFIHPDDIELIRNEIAEAFVSLKDSSFTFRFIHKDGITRHGMSQWKFELNDQGRPIRIYGIIQDITERKIAEEERLQIVEELLQRNIDLEQFAYIVSHNLRAPVANIVGFAEVLLNPDLNTETRSKFKAALFSSSQKLDTVIKDLANILQVRRAVNEPREHVCLSELVDDIRGSISSMIETEKADIQYDFPINEITAIKTYMHSIFYNLISNSIKYRQPGVAPVISIESRRSDNKIALIFRDNGMGIDLENRQDQVFGLYKRFHPHIEGKGVGLFMTKTQVETMGGKITINSKVNEGTEFKMEFSL
jgi:PAS domain S-box-containing protein